MRRLPGEVGVDGDVESGLAELAENHGTKLGQVERGRAECDQRLGASLVELLAGSPGDPLRQHGERPPGLLKLAERTPLALKHRQRRGMEGVAGLEPAPQKLPCLRLRRRGVHGQPLRGQAGAALEAPVRESPCDSLARALVAKVLKQAPAHHLADLGFVVGDQIAGDPADHLGDPLLPLLVPVGHLDLAARQADDRRGAGGPGNRDGQVLEKGMEALGHAAVAVDEVQHLVEQQQYGSVRGGEYPGQCFGSRRRGLGGRAERGDTPIARELTRKVDPGRLATLGGVPGVAYEYASAGGGRFRHPAPGQKVADSGECRATGARVGEVVEGGESVRLAAAELRDQREHRRRVPGSAGESPEHHAGVLLQRAREARTGEELRRVAIVFGCVSGHHLFQGNRELVRAERAALSHLPAKRDRPVPGIHQPSPRSSRTPVRIRTRFLVTTTSAPARIESPWCFSSLRTAASFSATCMPTKRMMHGYGNRCTNGSSPKSSSS